MPASSVRGALAVPGAKSISHRALLLAALAEGVSEIRDFGRCADVESTIGALRALSVEVDEVGDELLRVRGVGLRGLRAPAEPIDCGNAGTLMRLLAGVLAGQEGEFTLTGDESLRRRPMERVAEPLRAMGAHVETSEGRAPVRIRGGALRSIRYELPVASAQVKSAVLLAGLLADGATTVVEPVATRDHTERLLGAIGVRVQRGAREVRVWPVERIPAFTVDVPGDFSSAAPFVLAATLLPGSELVLSGVNVNATRIGFLHVLERMGARISLFDRRTAAGEPVADIEVGSAELVATEVEPAEVPALVDELPLFALAGALARGESGVRGARELREKESDRIETVTTALRALEVRIQDSEDGFRVRGVPARPRGNVGPGVDARGDHRIAMLGGVAGLVSREGVRIRGDEAVAVSFPGFFDLLESVAQR